MKWRPIETAPKDGERVLVTPSIYVNDPCCIASWRCEQFGWMVAGTPMGFEPTHWMRLPPPPQDTN